MKQSYKVIWTHLINAGVPAISYEMLTYKEAQRLRNKGCQVILQQPAHKKYNWS